MTQTSNLGLLFSIVGIYASFLTWALVQEPLNTKVWPQSDAKFQCPNVIAIFQAFCAMCIGYCYLKWKKSSYQPWTLIKDHAKAMAIISFTQSTSAPLAAYSLQYVDYLTFMLAKSCKMIPVLLVHLLLYRTPISNQKKIVAVLVSMGVTIFTIGGSSKKVTHSSQSFNVTNLYGFGLLATSLFLDGLTNAKQDKMLKKASPSSGKIDKSNKEKEEKAPQAKTITGSHLMFALNLFIVLWNIVYLTIFHKQQIFDAINIIQLDNEILLYLFTYCICGALGQCFIFYTLENYGSLVLIMITVTRKMMSMILSIVIFGKTVNITQWVGIIIVFSGIIWEAMDKKNSAKAKVKKE